MSEKVIVIGASGHGKVAADIVRSSGDTLLGFLDDNALLPPEIARARQGRGLRKLSGRVLRDWDRQFCRPGKNRAAA